MRELNFFHATIANLDGQPLFARGDIPTVHTSLTYAAWYGYWLGNMAGRGNQFQIYHLVGAARYLAHATDGMFRVMPVGSFEQDDRDPRVLEQAPELFRKRWNWGGHLTYIPARCLEKLSLPTIRAGIDPDEWEELSSEVNSRFRPARWGRRQGKMNFPLTVPDFLR